ncbi:MAG: SOS response-associated peptidase [Chloroflexi bacterium]|nr:SOS response-associated peptidase [Chloroflexota bacterium]
MCGRFTLTADIPALQELFPWLSFPADLTPRYNIAPSQPVAVIANDGENRLDFYSWGLIPSWAKDPSIGNKMINARAETLQEKPSFRAAFRRRRCLILADGFYEWRQEAAGPKTPMYIRLASAAPFAFAGLWETWNAPDGSQILSTAIITTSPNELMASIHNRMPVILPQAAHAQWLQPGEGDPAALQALLAPYAAAEMTAFPVSRLVNDPKNDRRECLLPVA